MSWIDRGVRSGTVKVLSETAEVASVSFEDLDALCRKHTQIGYLVTRNIAADLSFRIRQQNLYG